MDLAQALDGRHTAVGDALEAGEVTVEQAEVLVTGLAALPDDVAAALEPELLAAAPGDTRAALRARVRRAVLRAEPEAAHQRAEEAARRRRAFVQPEPDGQSLLGVLLPAEDARTCWNSLTALAAAAVQADRVDRVDRTAASPAPELASPVAADGAEPAPVPRRTLDQARVDVLVDLLRDAADHLGDEPPRDRRRPHVDLLVDLATLEGRAAEPGHLTGHGWITPEAARRLAADAHLRCLVTDPVTGQVLTVGRIERPSQQAGEEVVGTGAGTGTSSPTGSGSGTGTGTGTGRSGSEGLDPRRHPDQRTAAYVDARDGTCRFPGCRRPARASQVDHVRRHAEHGPTHPDNLQALCLAHHRLKSVGGWQVDVGADSTTTWRSPGGQELVVPPHRPGMTGSGGGGSAADTRDGGADVAPTAGIPRARPRRPFGNGGTAETSGSPPHRPGWRAERSSGQPPDRPPDQPPDQPPDGQPDQPGSSHRRACRT